MAATGYVSIGFEHWQKGVAPDKNHMPPRALDCAENLSIAVQRNGQSLGRALSMLGRSATTLGSKKICRQRACQVAMALALRQEVHGVQQRLEYVSTQVGLIGKCR